MSTPTTTTTNGHLPGERLLRLLSLHVIGTEGHDAKCPCVFCTSSDAMRVRTDTGVTHCFACGKSASPLQLAMAAKACDQRAAFSILADAGLAEPPRNGQSNGHADGHQGDGASRSPLTSQQKLDAVATAKHVTPDGLLAYGGQAAGSFYHKCVRFPAYGPDGKICTTSTINLDGPHPEVDSKGRTEKGKPTGIYLPHENGAVRLPKAGETWLIGEGLKDGAAAWKLGYLWAGTNGPRLNTSKHDYTYLFAGVNVILVPDLDHAGLQGSKENAKVLFSKAASVKLARLPGDIAQSKGADLRDCLATHGADAVRTAIDAAEWVDSEHPAYAGLASGQQEDEQAPPAKIEIAFLDSCELDQGEFKQSYLITDAITEKQGGIISAGYKLLKTSIAVDAGVSGASGTPFLGHYTVPEARRVAIFSAESGLSALQETARRVCTARGLSLRDLGDTLLWSTARVALTGQSAVDAMGDAITARDVKLAIIDPTYLYFPLGNTSANLYAVGESLAPISDLIESTGCTVILVNHNVKHRGPDIGQFAPPELSEISGSGWAEWARFWLLLGRRREWDCDTGQHWLWLQTGGSAGHAGLVAVDVTEGKKTDPGGRRWEVSVSAAGDARAAARQDAERRKAADREKREADYERRIFDAIKLCPDGETQSQLCRLAGINGTHFLPAIRSLTQGGKVTQIIIKKNNKQEKAYVAIVQ